MHSLFHMFLSISAIKILDRNIYILSNKILEITHLSNILTDSLMFKDSFMNNLRVLLVGDYK